MPESDGVAPPCGGDRAHVSLIVSTAMDEQRGSQDAGYRIISYLITGILLYGGLGWVADRWFGTTWVTPVGLILGTGLSLYAIVRRFGHTR